MRFGYLLRFMAPLLSLVCSFATAERVGYRFEGVLAGGATGTYTLFGVAVPRNSPISGTFSYDTTASGADAEPGVRVFHQNISGGYTLNINSTAIHLAASDYTITVANDFGSPASDLFTVDYNYDGANGITPQQLLANGTTWSGARAYIKVSLSWDPATFTGPEEPLLTADRPSVPNAATSGLVGSSGTPRLFNITSISAIPLQIGDYNRDGQIDVNDYAEWRGAFGQAEAEYLYADGDGDTLIDAADYVIWRKALTPLLGTSLVPEPSSLAFAFAGLMPFVVRTRRW